MYTHRLKKINELIYYKRSDSVKRNKQIQK